MNTNQKGIITLLRSAVTGEVLPLPEDFDMESAYQQILRHHMTTLAYEGAVRCGVPRNTDTMRKLLRRYCNAMMTSEGQLREIDRIFNAFDEQGIDYLPLKGCNMKALYPKPELRIMGDADVLIRLEQYDRIVPIMEGLGFTARHESDHELIWTSDSLFLELHKYVIPTYNKDFYAYFGDGWKLATVKNGSCYSMTAEDEWIYLFTHFAKHYRDGGIGCRHVVDLWVYLRANPDLDEAYVRAELKKLHLLEFYKNVRRLIAVWFENVGTDEKMDCITDFIFTSGSWGEWESKILSQSVRHSKHAPVGFNGRLTYLWRLAFPGVEGLRDKYKVLRRAPYLLPVVWLYRPVYKILFERKSFEDHIKGLNALEQDKVDAKQQMLNYVGLDFY